MRYLVAISILFLWLPSQGQSFKLKKYSEQEGLKNRFIYSIDQDKKGRLWIGTGEGLFSYDGFHFTEYRSENGLGDNFITCSYEDSQGNIWFGHNNGRLTKFDGNQLSNFDISEITTSKINQISEDKDHNLWFLSQNDGLLKLEAGNTCTTYSKGIEDLTLFSFLFDHKGKLWLGTDMGLLSARIGEGGEITYDFIDEIIETKVTSIIHQKDKIFVGTDDSGVFVVEYESDVVKINPVLYNETDFSEYIVNSLYSDEEENLWIGTNTKGLLQLMAPEGNNYHKLVTYRDINKANTASIRICKKDREGNVWIGTTGDGLIRVVDDYFSVFGIQNDNQDSKIYSVLEKNDTIWYGGTGTIYYSVDSPDKLAGKFDTKNGLPDCAVTAIHIDSQNNLYAGTLCGGLYSLNRAKNKFEHIELEVNVTDQKVNDVISQNEMIFVATDFGIYQLLKKKVVSHMSIQSGLPHNVIKSLYKDSRGKIWIGTTNNQVTYIENGIIQNIPSPFDNTLLEFTNITEDNDGNIWLGTDGSGVIRVSDDKAIGYTKSSGLYSDYCYSIACDNRNQLWVGHHGALSRINLNTDQIKIIDPGNEYDFHFSDNAIDKFPNGILIFGTDKGLLQYEPEKDRKNNVEPTIEIKSILLSDSLLPVQPEYRLSYGNYKLRFDFIAISLKNPEGVTYQYMLEGYDTDWSDSKSTRYAEYNKLSSGTYTFKVRAFNSDGFGGSQIQQVRFFIDKPFYLKWWFIISCIILSVLVIRYFILRRERFLKANQEYLKKELDERTREVVEQKELLEVKNKDITDSIIYAKNIQKAMLPSPTALNNYFEDAFVYFKPRDIVSGDFYSVEKFNDTIVVAVADCTGHGVPGAFMSLIGSTLLKEVASDKSVRDSKQVLEHLDLALKDMLNKQGDAFAVEDGMDICVFDYNVVTRKIRIASANRPIILFHQNEWLDLKGDRQSLGGTTRGPRKEFTQHEFTLAPGDMIYMYSDGITDQFGGDEGKKLKRSGLFQWVQQTTSTTMLEQRSKLKVKFEKWKGLHPQIDDIIMLGIRF